MNEQQAPVAPRGWSTMSDVAAAAGVSLKSVSRVINDEPHVSPKLRAKVEAAITALDFVPDPAARSLASQRNHTIGVLLDNPSPNYSMKVMTGAYRACVARKNHLRLDTLDSTRGPELLLEQLSDVVRHSRTDGFILTPPLCDDPVVLDFLEARGAAYARIAPVFAPGRSPAVTIDDYAAAGLVADLFWAKGHRRIGLVNGPEDHGAARTRREGFLARLRTHDPDIFVSEANGGFSFGGGLEAGRELLAPRRYPTAIFATNDDSAAGVMVACAQNDIRVPDQVSICGFDDSWVAMSVWPYLTTVRQPIEDMAETAALQLIDRGRQGGLPDLRQLDFELIERNSVADRP